MNILFLTMARITSLSSSGIYLDLFRNIVSKGHKVYIAAPAERHLKEETNLKEFDGYSVLRIKVGNLQKTNLIEKGISTLMLEGQFLAAIKKYFSDVKFDMVIYSTPPITFTKVIDFIKKRDGAVSYLLLKDIFPQNAVDLEMFSKKSVIYKYFRSKEKKLYRQSDYIGCMSQANVDYVLKHNPFVDRDIVHISPNSLEISEEKISVNIKEIRNKFKIPLDAKVFLYGGNLGKPQGIPFLIDCLKANMRKNDRFFVICGTGTEYTRLKAFFNEQKPDNMLLINGLPVDEYNRLVCACDVGLIFLDKRFTIPNFPSRLLSYMQYSMPVLAATDKSTDIGKVISEGDFGWWCESADAEIFTKTIDEALTRKDEFDVLGKNAYNYMEKNYNVDSQAETIIACFKKTIEKRKKL